MTDNNFIETAITTEFCINPEKKTYRAKFEKKVLVYIMQIKYVTFIQKCIR